MMIPKSSHSEFKQQESNIQAPRRISSRSSTYVGSKRIEDGNQSDIETLKNDFHPKDPSIRQASLSRHSSTHGFDSSYDNDWRFHHRGGGSSGWDIDGDPDDDDDDDVSLNPDIGAASSNIANGDDDSLTLATPSPPVSPTSSPLQTSRVRASSSASETSKLTNLVPSKVVYHQRNPIATLTPSRSPLASISTDENITSPGKQANGAGIRYRRRRGFEGRRWRILEPRGYQQPLRVSSSTGTLNTIQRQDSLENLDRATGIDEYSKNLSGSQKIQKPNTSWFPNRFTIKKYRGNLSSYSRSASSIFALYASRYAREKFHLALDVFKKWYHEHLTYHHLSRRMEFNQQMFDRWYRAKGAPLNLRTMDRYDQIVIWIAGKSSFQRDRDSYRMIWSSDVSYRPSGYIWFNVRYSSSDWIERVEALWMLRDSTLAACLRPLAELQSSGFTWMINNPTRPLIDSYGIEWQSNQNMSSTFLRSIYVKLDWQRKRYCDTVDNFSWYFFTPQELIWSIFKPNRVSLSKYLSCHWWV